MKTIMCRTGVLKYYVLHRTAYCIICNIVMLLHIVFYLFLWLDQITRRCMKGMRVFFEHFVKYIILEKKTKTVWWKVQSNILWETQRWKHHSRCVIFINNTCRVVESTTKMCLMQQEVHSMSSMGLCHWIYHNISQKNYTCMQYHNVLILA